MDHEQPPLTCAQCSKVKVIEPNDAITLAVREGSGPGEWSGEDLATLHQACWDAFRREHKLPGAAPAPRLHEPDF